MAKSKITPHIFILEDLIRKGQIRPAQGILQDFAKGPIPRALLGRVASLARRASLPELGLRLLYPRVAPGAALGDDTDALRAEFGANLIRLGAPREALAILKRLNATALPEVSLFTAYALIGEWRYAEAMLPLKEYLSRKDLDPYLVLVARTNLASCHIHEGQFTQAHELLKSIKDEAEERGYLLLFGAAWKMTAFAQIASEDITEARTALQLAERALLRAGDLDKIFIAKWTAILDLKAEGPSPRCLRMMADVKKRALIGRHWETVRDCDRALLYAKPDQALYERLYFGTPYASFREQLKSHFGDKLTLPLQYEWRVGKPSRQSKRISVSEMGDGDTSHRLMLTLCSDFYRPFRTAALFDQIFAGEYFNPDSSPVRIRVSIQRLRASLKKSRIPLVIDIKNGEYQISEASKVTILLSTPSNAHGRQDILFERLKLAAGAEEFTAKQVAEKLSTSTRTIQRLLEEHVKLGQVIRLGGSRTTRYRF